MEVFVYLKEDISRLIKEGRLDIKLNELDQLEAAAKNNAEPAWSVSSTKTTLPSTTFCLPFQWNNSTGYTSSSLVSQL